MTKTAYITIGPAACGKSTWARKMLSNDSATDPWILSLDTFRAIVGSGEEDQTVTEEAVGLRDLVLQTASINDKNVIIADTNLDLRFLEQLVYSLVNMRFMIIEFHAWDVRLDTVRSRNAGRIRKVPDSVLVRQVASSEVVLPKLHDLMSACPAYAQYTVVVHKDDEPL